MSSHREAPEISMDPVADSTDLYAFVSPDHPDTVTLIANYIPLQSAAGGPNFYEFGEDVKYNIHIDTKGNGEANITYEFRFTTTVANPDTFLYNTGPIKSLNDPNWNRKQHYQIIRWDLVGKNVVRHDIAKNLACPPCNIGPLSTPNYGNALARPAVHTLSDGIKVFAGQRAEGFYVDLGSIFDLGNLRPFQQLTRLRQGTRAQLGGRRQRDQVPERALDRAADSEVADHRQEPSNHRRLDLGQQTPGAGLRGPRQEADLRWTVRPGLQARHAADQRSHHPDGPQGLLERPAASRRQAVRKVRGASRTRRAAPCALPGRVPDTSPP